MSNKIFGLGFSKTGTTSLEFALELLGYKVCKGHWASNYSFYLHSLYIHKDYNELIRMTKYWDAFADGPWGGTDLYLELYKVYPDAKYILTYRDPESWYKSMINMLTQFDSNLETALDTHHEVGKWGSSYFFSHIFNISNLANKKDILINHYNNHNNSVREFFHNKPDSFLEIDISIKDKWTPVCTFLSKPIPDKPYPLVNQTKKKDGYDIEKDRKVMLKKTIDSFKTDQI